MRVQAGGQEEAVRTAPSHQQACPLPGRLTVADEGLDYPFFPQSHVVEGQLLPLLLVPNKLRHA